MIKVLLVDDQQILAEGIKSVLETSGDLSVVGIASDGARNREMRRNKARRCVNGYPYAEYERGCRHKAH